MKHLKWITPYSEPDDEIMLMKQAIKKIADTDYHSPKNIADKIKYLTRKYTISGSKKNIADHYDLGNEFFASWFDPTLTYSSGLYDDFDATSLEDAQINKFKRIASTLNLKKGQKVLEIGCGWGGFLEFAASEIGVNITALTISEAQYKFVKNRIDGNDISQNATVIVEDYRQH